MSVEPCATDEAPDAAPRAVEGACASWHSADTAVKLVRSMLDAWIVALFAIDGERLILLASHGLTQDVLDAVADTWACGRVVLAAGLPRGSATLPAVVLPCGDEQGLAGLAYIEGPGVQRPSGLPLLLPLSQVFARVLRGADAHEQTSDEDGQATTHDADTAALYVLMERNEWNVARVARLMGVTRMTIYNRLRRARVQRKRVLKASRRGRRAPRVPPPDTDT